MSHAHDDRRSGDINEEKDGAMFCEDTASAHTRNQVPETLRDLTEDERAVLEKKLVRRIDLRLLPMLVIMYILNYLDRNNIASARLAGSVGMEEELGMTSTQYNVRLFACSTPCILRLTFFHRPASAFSSSVTLSCRCHPT